MVLYALTTCVGSAGNRRIAGKCFRNRIRRCSRDHLQCLGDRLLQSIRLALRLDRGESFLPWASTCRGDPALERRLVGRWQAAAYGLTLGSGGPEQPRRPLGLPCAQATAANSPTSCAIPYLSARSRHSARLSANGAPARL